MRDRDLEGITYECQSGCCRLYVTINYDAEGLKEVFINTAGTGCSALINGLGRSISVGLQHGVTPHEIAHTLSRSRCPMCAKNRDAEGASCADIVGKLLEETYDLVFCPER